MRKYEWRVLAVLVPPVIALLDGTGFLTSWGHGLRQPGIGAALVRGALTTAGGLALPVTLALLAYYAVRRYADRRIAADVEVLRKEIRSCAAAAKLPGDAALEALQQPRALASLLQLSFLPSGVMISKPDPLEREGLTLGNRLGVIHLDILDDGSTMWRWITPETSETAPSEDGLAVIDPL
jgi:hypothetical protein